MSTRVFVYDELHIDRKIAPLLASSKTISLRAVVLELDSELARVAAIEQSAALADWVTGRKSVEVRLVSKETFSRLVDELGIT